MHTRVGPDGFGVIREVAVSYIQMLDGSIRELGQLAAVDGSALQVPIGVDAE